ncbi:armadillo repeat-containing protein 3 [Anabrus simplex]|uniref:armadillo repeat-containing protein 3 n=1 Tax=Anabrus simplex TaxID=316456 RepID=UPI0035A28907
MAVSALDKFASKSTENLLTLIDLKILDHLLDLIYNNDVQIRRFSAKLLGVLCALEVTKELLLQDDRIISHFVNVFVKESDIIMQEFSSLIIAELTVMHLACEFVSKTHIFDVLFSRILSYDPDVQKNTAQIIMNLLNDSETSEQLLKCREFRLEPIFKLLKSEYPVIQNLAIKILDALSYHYEDDNIQEQFCKYGGVETCVEILQIFDWKDLHAGLLGVLENVADNPQTATYLHAQGCIDKLIHYMEDIHDQEMVERTLAVVIKMANTDIGRQYLYDNHVLDSILRHIRDESSGVVQGACMAIAQMTNHYKAVETLVNEFPIREVTSIMKNDTRSWEARQAAAHALCCLLRVDKRFCIGAVETRRHEMLLHLLHQPKVPVEMLVTIVNCFAALAMHAETRSRVMDLEFIEAITNLLQSNDPSDALLRIAACMCLCKYTSESGMWDEFNKADGVSKLITTLKDRHMPVRQAATSLLQFMASEKGLTNSFINQGALDWMLKQKSTRLVCPQFETAIEALFKNCLPAKFAYMGKLDIQDITSEGFYVTKYTHHRFPVLDELLTSRACPLFPIYIAVFNTISPAVPVPRSTPKPAPRTPRGSSRRGADKYKSATSVTSAQLEELEQQPPPPSEVISADPFMIEYLEELYNIIAQRTSDGDKLSTAELVEILAKFVNDQMCGPSPRIPCSQHTHGLHLLELRQQLETNIIPLGYIRIGLHLERAVLFKVLADKIGLLCSLVRGQYGISWVEVAILQPDPPGEEFPLPITDLPIRLIRTNHIVDLMENIGSLMPIGSYEATVYCGQPI